VIVCTPSDDGFFVGMNRVADTFPEASVNDEASIIPNVVEK
jgi:hypothetical protein